MKAKWFCLIYCGGFKNFYSFFGQKRCRLRKQSQPVPLIGTDGQQNQELTAFLILLLLHSQFVPATVLRAYESPQLLH